LQEYWVSCIFRSVTVETVHQALALSTGRHALIKLGSWHFLHRSHDMPCSEDSNE
jgi:hypothetical protein